MRRIQGCIAGASRGAIVWTMLLMMACTSAPPSPSEEDRETWAPEVEEADDVAEEDAEEPPVPDLDTLEDPRSPDVDEVQQEEVDEEDDPADTGGEDDVDTADTYTDPPPERWSLVYARGETAENFTVLASLYGVDGERLPVAAEEATIRVEGAELVSVSSNEDESLVLELRALRLDAGVDLVLEHVLGPRMVRELLPLAEVHDLWGLPEFVPGAVNTPGWEDSSEVSPDGQWLIVSSYTPVDAFSCTLVGNDVGAPVCNRSLGPWEAPLRPDFPGAERVLDDDTLSHRAPSLCLVGEGGTDFPVAIPPTAAYGFRLQPDGSFGEPFVIAYAMDGYSVAPFGFSFVGELDANQATVVYAFADVREFDEKGFTPNLYTAPLTLGEPNTLGRFSCSPTEGVTYQEGVDARLPLLPHTVHKGNPYLEAEGARVWFDDEGAERSQVYFSVREGDTWSERRAAAAPVNEADVASYQPFLLEDRLYWARGFRSIRSAALEGDDPAAASGWTAPREEVGLGPVTGPPEDATPGTLVAIGEPSLAVDPDGVRWLYFVAIRRTESGYNADIARVRER